MQLLLPWLAAFLFADFWFIMNFLLILASLEVAEFILVWKVVAIRIVTYARYFSKKAIGNLQIFWIFVFDPWRYKLFTWSCMIQPQVFPVLIVFGLAFTSKSFAGNGLRGIKFPTGAKCGSNFWERLDFSHLSSNCPPSFALQIV